MQRFNVSNIAMHGAIAGVIGAGLGGLIWVNPNVPQLAALVPVLGAMVYFVWATRRWWRRMLADEEPSEEVRRTLERQVYFYRDRLKSDEARARFRREVHWFLLEHNIQGVGVEVTDELRALVASSAVVLGFGRPSHEWETTRDILLYPGAYDEDYRVHGQGRRLGQVSQQGSIILSAPALRAGFAKGTDGHNVGFHEFAHVLDFDDGSVDGIPANLNWRASQPWLEQMAIHFRRHDKPRRRHKVLRDYAFTNEAEFFACATEMFFEQPGLLKRRAPELYTLMVGFYGEALCGEVGST